jgi:mandelamide amidase
MEEAMYGEGRTNELLEWTACEAIQCIRNGSVTAENYASLLLKRYRESKALNAVTWIDENHVLEQARSVDTTRSKGQRLGPLAGLPVVIKDNISTVGFPTTAGTAILKGLFPQNDAPIAGALFKNGAILLGKTNMDELSRGFTSANPTFGFARNPYDISRVPGGGSGGSAAAIAARIAPAGLGSDTAGSVRIPAAYCGIAGLRPSSGGHRHRAWTSGSWMVTSWDQGVVPIAYTITTPGPMGRAVADVALLHAIVTESEALMASSVRGARIGIPRGYYWEDVDAEILRILEAALQKLRDAGAVLIDVDLRQWAQTANQTFATLALMHSIKDLADFLATNAPGIGVNEVVAGLQSKDIQTRVQREIDNPISTEVASAARNTRVNLGMQYEELFRTNNLSAIAFPIAPVSGPKIGINGQPPDDTITLNGRQVSYFVTVGRNAHNSSVAGTPSLSVPAGLSSSGMPVGLALDGLTGRDSALLGLGISVETVLGRMPPPRFPLAGSI